MWDALVARIKRYGSSNLLLVFLLLPVCLLVWLSLGRIERLQCQGVESSLQAILTTTANALTMWSEDLKSGTKVTATQEEVRRATQAQLAAYKAGGLNTPALDDLRRLLEPLAVEYGQLGFAVVAPDGTQIATRFDSLLGQKDLMEQDPETISSALAGNVALGLPFRSAVPLPTEGGVGTPVMICAAPVRDASGAVIAALAVRLDPARRFTAVVQLGRIGRTGESYLFDRSGHLLTESRFDEHLREIGLVPPEGHGLLTIEIRDPGMDLTRTSDTPPPRAEQPLTEMAQSATRGHAGVNVDGYRDYRGVPVVGVWRWLDHLDVGIATEMDRAEAHGPIKAVRNLSLMMLGVLVAVAISVTVVLSRRARRLAAAVASENAAVRMRDELLAAVSHDLRNPLSSILLTASMIERTAGTEGASERARKLARSIQSAARRMARLIDDLLSRARIEAGQMQIERTRQDPEKLIAQTLEVLSPLASAKQIELEGKVGADLPPISADPDRLFDVLANLAGNAIKFTPEHGKVTVGAALVDEEVDFSVTDNGPGIPPEELPHLFERYWRGKSWGGLGLGLGLYIAKQIVERHGGRIWAESRPGRGSTFHFRLGVAQPA